ncbi:thioredoxin-like protein [Hyaloraphidium curvatum]|nr:thioredoxin-like protein [Hyaloraphidium curvatum]
MNEVFEELSKKYPDLKFLKIEAENVPDVSEEFEIDAVPSFVVLKDRKQIAERISGASAPELSAAVAKAAKLSAAAVAAASAKAAAGPQEAAISASADPNERFKKLVSQYDVFLAMKGTPSQPRCGFSRQLVEILKEQQVDYGFYNILSNEEVRQGLKTWANWPTYPMLFVKGELVGGIDIVKEMIASGEFEKTVPRNNTEQKLKALVSKEPVMCFIKGTPEAPRCGFSRQIVTILKEQGVEFGYFDILEDEEVRAGLKQLFDWPTFPQLYVKGELIGGLDIVKEMVASGEFKDVVAPATQAAL